MDSGWVFPTVSALVAAVLSELTRRQNELNKKQEKILQGQTVIHNLVNSNLTLVKAARDAAESLAATLSLQLVQRDAQIEELRHQIARLSKP